MRHTSVTDRRTNTNATTTYTALSNRKYVCLQFDDDQDLHQFSFDCLQVLCRCWLGGRKGIRRVKSEWWGAGVVICLERGADLHTAQLMLLPLTVSCFSKIQIGFTFLVPAYPGSPGQTLNVRSIFGHKTASRAKARIE